MAFAVFNLGLGAGSPHQLLGLGLFLLLFGHNVVDGATMVGAAAVMRRQPTTVVATGAPVVGRWGHPVPASPATAVQRKLRGERHGHGGTRGGRLGVVLWRRRLMGRRRRCGRRGKLWMRLRKVQVWGVELGAEVG